METVESLGFIQFWGVSKWLNLLKDTQIEQQKEYKVFVSGGADMRHIFKTCLELSKEKNIKLTFYVHEKSKESLCRQLLMLLVLHTVNYSYRDRSDIFLDIFGNSLIRDKTALYIDKLIPYIDSLISDEKKCQSALNKIISLQELKFKDRDEIVEVVRSWYSNNPFQIDQLRDQRLRYHYKNRYDFRLNLIDWDYQMNLKPYASIIHFYHYREWRQTGVAFESRFSTYPTPNRTLSSYLPGKKKNTRESCLVRGFWGDITVSPYISYGISTDVVPEKDKLFKITNLQQVSHSVAVSEFNVQHMIQMFDNLSEYHIDFEGDIKKEEKKEQELEKIEEKDGDDETEEEKQQEKNEEVIQDKKDETKVVDSKQEIIGEDYVISSEPLLVFQNLSLQIVPIFDDIEKICGRSKFKEFFDAGYVGFFNSAVLNKDELKQIFKTDAHLYMENARYLVTLKKEEKQGAFENIQKIGKDKGWIPVEVEESNDYISFKKQAP